METKAEQRPTHCQTRDCPNEVSKAFQIPNILSKNDNGVKGEEGYGWVDLEVDRWFCIGSGVCGLETQDMHM